MKQVHDHFASGDGIGDDVNESAGHGKLVAEAGDGIGAGALVAHGAARVEGRRAGGTVAFRHGFAHRVA